METDTIIWIMIFSIVIIFFAAMLYIVNAAMKDDIDREEVEEYEEEEDDKEEEYKGYWKYPKPKSDSDWFGYIAIALYIAFLVIIFLVI